ncbi:MAG: hypothetical protein CMP23_16320 [Rickettsiales bacterium]|nr:hypothetical protein [Rickettsiales bacterium]
MDIGHRGTPSPQPGIAPRHNLLPRTLLHCKPRCTGFIEVPDARSAQPKRGTQTILTWLKASGSYVKGELDAFKKALQSAPEPELSWDFLAIRRSLLRLWSVLKNEHSSPPRIAAAVFLGIVIGCSPFYGFHVILCLALAFLLRLNKLVVWLGCNVSLPIFAPFLTFASIQCGHLLVHGSWAEISVQLIRDTPALQWFGYWTLGFIPVGSLLGGAFAALVLLKLKPKGELK